MGGGFGDVDFVWCWGWVLVVSGFCGCVGGCVIDCGDGFWVYGEGCVCYWGELWYWVCDCVGVGG